LFCVYIYIYFWRIFARINSKVNSIFLLFLCIYVKYLKLDVTHITEISKHEIKVILFYIILLIRTVSALKLSVAVYPVLSDEKDTCYKVYVCSIQYIPYFHRKTCRLTYVVVFSKFIERHYFPHVSCFPCLASTCNIFRTQILDIIQQRNIVSQVRARVEGSIKFRINFLNEIHYYIYYIIREWNRYLISATMLWYITHILNCYFKTCVCQRTCGMCILHKGCVSDAVYCRLRKWSLSFSKI